MGFSVSVRKRKAPEPDALLSAASKAAIGRGDHGVGRAEILLQGIEPAGAGPARREIGEDVGTAEGIDRLLGVADENERGLGIVGRNPIDGIEDPILHRIRVLKLVDQGDRELTSDDLGEARRRSGRSRRHRAGSGDR
jgi:hypothetical protein